MPHHHPRILVVNPNSNEAVTRGIETALAPLANGAAAEIVCQTLREGPAGIESQADVESVTMPLMRLVGGDNAASAFVIACYSDPGLHVCREAAGRRPVFGIAECGVLSALARADRFGVIAIRTGSIPRHRRALRQMGVAERLAGERALEMSVAETVSGETTFRRMVEVGRELRDRDGAGAIVLGCAGMAAHRKPLEEELDLPVIDPTQASVAMALGAVAFG